MMKYVGIFIMAGSLMGGGFLAAKRWQDRLSVLLLFRQMIYHLKGQILYVNAALPEALSEVGTRFPGEGQGSLTKPGQLFLQVARRMEEEGDQPFSLLWREAVAGLPADFPMDGTDRQALLSLGDQLGYADREMQERILMLYLEQTEESIKTLRRELESRTKLYRSLGVAAGLFLMVIMV